MPLLHGPPVQKIINFRYIQPIYKHSVFGSNSDEFRSKCYQCTLSSILFLIIYTLLITRMCMYSTHNTRLCLGSPNLGMYDKIVSYQWRIEKRLLRRNIHLLEVSTREYVCGNYEKMFINSKSNSILYSVGNNNKKLQLRVESGASLEVCLGAALRAQVYHL